jgi:hypothetical protein
LTRTGFKTETTNVNTQNNSQIKIKEYQNCI